MRESSCANVRAACATAKGLPLSSSSSASILPHLLRGEMKFHRFAGHAVALVLGLALRQA
eukprot:3140555-Pleurochrysis_carterae.AAC.4